MLKCCIIYSARARSSVGRVLHSHCRGRGFDSLRVHQKKQHILLCCFSIELFGQHLYGTTGLIVAPTAEMQKDKTIMIGGSMIDHNIYRSSYWSNSREYNPYPLITT